MIDLQSPSIPWVTVSFPPYMKRLRVNYKIRGTMLKNDITN
jgi:hypothetical protein